MSEPADSLARALIRCTEFEITNHQLRKDIEAMKAENETLRRKLHDAIVQKQRLLMQYEPAKAAELAEAAIWSGDK